jgi:hypothetical protein
MPAQGSFFALTKLNDIPEMNGLLSIQTVVYSAI